MCYIHQLLLYIDVVITICLFPLSPPLILPIAPAPPSKHQLCIRAFLINLSPNINPFISKGQTALPVRPLWIYFTFAYLYLCVSHLQQNHKSDVIKLIDVIYRWNWQYAPIFSQPVHEDWQNRLLHSLRAASIRTHTHTHTHSRTDPWRLYEWENEQLS